MNRRGMTHGLGTVAALQRARVALIDVGRLISLSGTKVGGGEPVTWGEGSGKGGQNEEDGSEGAGEHPDMKVFERKSSKGLGSKTGTCLTEGSTSKAGAFLYQFQERGNLKAFSHLVVFRTVAADAKCHCATFPNTNARADMYFNA